MFDCKADTCGANKYTISFSLNVSIFVSILFLSHSSNAWTVHHLRSISLYIFALSISNLKNSLYSGSMVCNFGILKLVNWRGFHANTNSNGDSP